MILLELHEKLHSIQCPSFYSHSALERQGSSICGCLMSWLRNLKKKSFWSVIFSYSVQQKWSISQLNFDVWWKVDFIQQSGTTSSVFGLRRISKALPKAKLAPKKNVMVTVWSSAACLIHYSFLNPSETITSEKYAQQIDLLFSHSVMFDSLRPHGLQHARFPCPSSPGACSNSSP